jgi:HK97 family phage portal protein
VINLLRHFSNKKVVQKSFFSYLGTNEPQWTPCRYDAISEDGFQKNAIAFRAINLISRGVSSIPLVVKNCSDMKENDSLTSILNRPNKRQSRSAFFETIVNYLLISGNVFIHCDDDNQFHCLRPDRVQIVPNDSKTDIESYIYVVDSSKFSIDKENLLHIKFFNPLNDWYGFSPLQVASRAIDQHNAMSDHNLSILQNGGRPSGCLIVKNDAENLTDEQREQLRSDIRSAYSGTLNAGKMMVLEGNFEWKEMGLSPKDLDFSTGKNITSREIAQAFGVPPILVGLHGDSTFSNQKEARLHLWEDTILPLADLIRLEFSNWLSQKFKNELEIIFDLDAVHALTSRREVLWQKISNADFLTQNEKREILGFPPLKESKE